MSIGVCDLEGNIMFNSIVFSGIDFHQFLVFLVCGNNICRSATAFRPVVLGPTYVALTIKGRRRVSMLLPRRSGAALGAGGTGVSTPCVGMATKATTLSLRTRDTVVLIPMCIRLIPMLILAFQSFLTPVAVVIRFRNFSGAYRRQIMLIIDHVILFFHKELRH